MCTIDTTYYPNYFNGNFAGKKVLTADKDGAENGKLQNVVG